MNTIKTDIWEQHPEKQGCLRYVKQRKASEVFLELENYLKSENLYPDEYFLLNRNYDDSKCDFPKFTDIICYAQWGGNEGVYLEVELLLYNESSKSYNRSVFATGKTLGESKEAFERMQYIAAQIYMAFMDDRFQSGRYVVADKSPMKNVRSLKNKLNFEMKNYINHKLLRESLTASEIAKKLGTMSLILDVITTMNMSDAKVVELLKKDNVLESLGELCDAAIGVAQFEIKERILSLPVLPDKEAENV